MNPDDVYVKKIPTYNIIQYTGDNREEVGEFLASRGCTEYISSPEGDIHGTYDGMPPLLHQVWRVYRVQPTDQAG